MIDSANSAWTDLAIESIVVGVIATAVADLWVRLLQSVARLPAGNWALVGRWVAGFPRGVFVHRPISAAAPIRGELAIGWTFHYVVGLVYAAIYLVIVTVGLHAKPSFISALLFAWGDAHRALVRDAAGARSRLHGCACAEAGSLARHQLFRAHLVRHRPVPRCARVVRHELVQHLGGNL